MYLIPAILFSGCIVFNVSLFLEKRMGYSNKISKKISFTIFLAYVVVIFYTAFLSREPGSRKSISLVLFETWGCTFHMHAMFIENIIMFIPFGILNPLLFRKFRNARVCVLAGFICSCSVTTRGQVLERGYKEYSGVRPHKEKINISKEIINKTRRAVAPYAARMNHTPLRGEQ